VAKIRTLIRALILGAEISGRGVGENSAADHPGGGVQIVFWNTLYTNNNNVRIIAFFFFVSK